MKLIDDIRRLATLLTKKMNTLLRTLNLAQRVVVAMAIPSLALIVMLSAPAPMTRSSDPQLVAMYAARGYRPPLESNGDVKDHAGWWIFAVFVVAALEFWLWRTPKPPQNPYDLSEYQS